MMNKLKTKWNFFAAHYPKLAAIDMSMTLVSLIAILVWATN